MTEESDMCDKCGKIVEAKQAKSHNVFCEVTSSTSVRAPVRLKCPNCKDNILASEKSFHERTCRGPFTGLVSLQSNLRLSPARCPDCFLAVTKQDLPSHMGTCGRNQKVKPKETINLSGQGSLAGSQEVKVMVMVTGKGESVSIRKPERVRCPECGMVVREMEKQKHVDQCTGEDIQHEK